jgi:hypothetical protein
MQEYDLFTSTVKVRHQDLRLCVFLHQPAIMRVIGMIAIRRTFREGNVIFLRFPGPAKAVTIRLLETTT